MQDNVQRKAVGHEMYSMRSKKIKFDILGEFNIFCKNEYLCKFYICSKFDVLFHKKVK
jgi:hypothetical protein